MTDNTKEASQNSTNNIVAVTAKAELDKIPRQKINIQKLFHKVSVLDYAVMWFIANKAEKADINQKFYLKDMAESSGLPMHIITEMVRKLRDKGLVEWTHDGNGENGTYVKITELGVSSVTAQRDILQDYNKNVIEKFGMERFLNLIREMSEFEEIMNAEIEKENNTDE